MTKVRINQDKNIDNDLYRVSKKTDAFHIQISHELIAGICLFLCYHVYSQHEVVNDCKSTVPIQISTIKMDINFHMELDLCFKLINGSLICFVY